MIIPQQYFMNEQTTNQEIKVIDWRLGSSGNTWFGYVGPKFRFWIQQKDDKTTRITDNTRSHRHGIDFANFDEAKAHANKYINTYE